MQLGCICLLLFAQQAALTHSAWHASGAHGAEESAEHEHPPDTDGHAGTERDLCGYHLALHDVTGGSCGGGTHAAAIAHSPAEHAFAALGRRSVEAVTQVSRGPPGLS
jgi:hypothetical protein